jgi:hypothetical protein
MLPFDEEQQSLNKSPLDEETLLSGSSDVVQRCPILAGT